MQHTKLPQGVPGPFFLQFQGPKNQPVSGTKLTWSVPKLKLVWGTTRHHRPFCTLITSTTIERKLQITFSSLILINFWHHWSLQNSYLSIPKGQSAIRTRMRTFNCMVEDFAGKSKSWNQEIFKTFPFLRIFQISLFLSIVFQLCLGYGREKGSGLSTKADIWLLSARTTCVTEPALSPYLPLSLSCNCFLRAVFCFPSTLFCHLILL